MDKKRQKKADLLEAAYNEMDTKQRSSVFSDLLKDTDMHLNSKNFMGITAK